MTQTLLILLLGTSSMIAQAAVSVNLFSLHSVTTPYLVGEDLYFDVLVQDAFAADPADELLGFGFNTQVTGSGQLQFLGSAVNPLFTDSSIDVNLDAAGIAFPGLTANNTDPVFSLATLHFKALAAGSVSLAVVSDLLDPNQGLVFLNQQPLSLAASQNLNVTAVPIPAAGWMLVSMLGLFVTVARRR
jgi:hypothetical protein